MGQATGTACQAPSGRGLLYGGTHLAQRIGTSLRSRRFLVVLLFLLGLGVRLPAIDMPPLEFHATRQYRSLVIARAYYYESTPSVPGWKREIADLNRAKQGVLEPPVLEFLVSRLYRLVGREEFAIPRFLSAVFWVIGGAFLYATAGRTVGAVGAVFAAAFYLFLPFGVTASRSFQPDPLMMMLTLGSLLAILRYDDRPSEIRLALATVVAASAAFVKPVSLFPTIGAFVALTLSRGSLRCLASRHVAVFVAGAVAPALLFYAYGILSGGEIRRQAQSSFLLHLWFDRFFWSGWLANIRVVVGLPAFLLALLGIFALPAGRSRAFLLGLWSGYILFCLAFTYSIATHDYYHLPLVPIVALSLGAPVTVLIQHVLALNRAWVARGAIAGISLLALALTVWTVRPRVVADVARRAAAEEIGEAVGHSRRLVYLAADYGMSLEYHGEVSGMAWPLDQDRQWERLVGLTPPEARARFDKRFAQASPEFFVVLDLREFQRQDDLQRFLIANFPLVAQNDQYLIFDLRRRLRSAEAAEDRDG